MRRIVAGVAPTFNSDEFWRWSAFGLPRQFPTLPARFTIAITGSTSPADHNERMGTDRFHPLAPGPAWAAIHSFVLHRQKVNFAPS